MTANSIPASAIVNILPGVIGAGGQALDLVGLVLTQNTAVPVGQVVSLPTYGAVATYFGAGSTEAAIAEIYFGGFDGATASPGAILFYQYTGGAAVSAYLRGANISTMSLETLQSLNGVLTLTVDATSYSGVVDLAAATSFSAAAQIIQSALGLPSVAYESEFGAFVITSGTTGAASLATYASGAIAAQLGLTQNAGAVLSQGAAAGDPASVLNGVITQTRNFATIMTAFETSKAQKVEIAAWVNGQGDEFLYVANDTDATPTNTGDVSSAGYQIAQAAYNGVALLYAPAGAVQTTAGGPSLDLGIAQAAFVCGAIASIDFTAANGRTDLAFCSQSGLTPGVTSPTIAANLIANGYNFYGCYGTSNQTFNFLYPGQMTGPFAWIDSYVNQIWLNNALQLALMELMTHVGSIPYNAAGYALIQAACADPINAALNFGAIRAGVTLSAAQTAEINSAAGLNIATTLQNRGWYLLIQPATAQVRGARQSPPITLYYTDGGDIQQLTVSSLEVA